MKTFHSDFADVIQSALSNPLWSENAKLILFGRIAYAVERGDLTVSEGQALMEQMENGMRERYSVPLQLAMFGETDDQLTNTVTSQLPLAVPSSS
jgi:hypothetical protein